MKAIGKKTRRGFDSRPADYAGMMELVDSSDLGSLVERRAGSTPATRTILLRIC